MYLRDWCALSGPFFFNIILCDDREYFLLCKRSFSKLKSWLIVDVKVVFRGNKDLLLILLLMMMILVMIMMIRLETVMKKMKIINR